MYSNICGCGKFAGKPCFFNLAFTMAEISSIFVFFLSNFHITELWICSCFLQETHVDTCRDRKYLGISFIIKRNKVFSVQLFFSNTFYQLFVDCSLASNDYNRFLIALAKLKWMLWLLPLKLTPWKTISLGGSSDGNSHSL